MRLLVDVLIVVMLTGALTGLLWYQHAEQNRLDRVEAVQRAIRVIESESLYRAALGEVASTPRGYARVIRAAWFDRQPTNLLAEDQEAAPSWLEHIDFQSERDRANPRQIVADREHAPFWYNPYRGVVRARVSMQLSRRMTVRLYNTINGTALRVEQVRWPRDESLTSETTALAPAAPSDL